MSRTASCAGAPEPAKLLRVAETVIYREEVLGIIGALADMLVELQDIGKALTDGEEEEEDDEQG